jgi:hypothetical protein
MEPIELRQERDFSEKINATFAFTVQHARPLGLCLLYFVSPLTLLAGIAGGLYQSNVLRMTQPAQVPFPRGRLAVFGNFFTVEYGLTMFFTSLAGLVLSLTVYAYLLRYEETGEASTPEQTWARVQPALLPGVGISLMYLVVVVIGMILCFLPGIYLAVALSLGYLVYMREGRGTVESLERSFQLVRIKWWSTFGLLVVVSIVVGIAAGILSIPTYLITFLTALRVIEGDQSLWLVGTSIISTTGSTILQAIVVLALAFQYYNLVEQKEGQGLLRRIADIGTTPRPRADEPGEY